MLRTAPQAQLRSALEVLTDVQDLLTHAPTGTEKARSELMIAGVSTRLDTIRGFEATQLAVNALNEADAALAPPTRPSDSTRMTGGIGTGSTVVLGGITGFDTLNFDQTLSVLARNNFDRTLSLAQEIKKKETALIAQLSVCRGVLRREKTSTQR